MCVVSYLGDAYRTDFPERWPNLPAGAPGSPSVIFSPGSISREEFEALRAEVRELRTLLEAAKQFDAKTGQPDCEMDEKVEFIRKLADFVGVDMGDVIGESPRGEP